MNAKLVHGGDVTGYTARHGRPPLDFSANLSPLGLPQRVREAAVRSLEGAAAYPDPLCRELTAAIAKSQGVLPGWVLCGSGAADLILRLALALRPRRALLAVPTFAEYRTALELGGCDVVTHPLSLQAGFVLGEDFTARLAADEAVDLVFLCNPNNPTGQTIPPSLLNRLLAFCRDRGTALILDECFQDFLDSRDRDMRTPWLERCPNLILLRAFTKSYAMAGLRLGYLLCADQAVVERVRAAGQPWAVSTPAQAAGLAALEEGDYLEEARALVARQRPLLRQGLERLGMTVMGSKANYLFFRSPIPDLPARLEARGILIRDCSNYEGLSPGYCRAAVRGPGDNRLLLEAVERVVS